MNIYTVTVQTNHPFVPELMVPTLAVSKPAACAQVYDEIECEGFSIQRMTAEFVSEPLPEPVRFVPNSDDQPGSEGTTS